MVKLRELENYLNDLLGVSRFQDFAPNGLQIEGKRAINVIVSGVTASQRMVNAAIENEADVLLVHHGYFWKGEPSSLTGIKYKRISALIKHEISLLAYHLPLDAHPVYGNNIQLANLLGIKAQGSFCAHGDAMIGLFGELKVELAADAFAETLKKKLGREAIFVAGGDHSVRTIGLCSGGAQNYIEEAAELGLDAFLSGEISEKTTHLAREMGIHYFAAGHHATERYGIQALGQHLKDVFDVHHIHVDIDNPA